MASNKEGNIIKKENSLQQKVKEVKGISVRSSDGKILNVSYGAAMEFGVIKAMFSAVSYEKGEIIPLPLVKAEMLKKLLTWIEEQSNNKNRKDSKSLIHTIFNLQCFEEDKNAVFELIKAANYLDIPTLYEAGCNVVAGLLKAKTPDEIRDTFDLSDDLSTEELQKLLRQADWND